MPAVMAMVVVKWPHYRYVENKDGEAGDEQADTGNGTEASAGVVTISSSRRPDADRPDERS